MRPLILALALTPLPAFAGGIDGVWKTNSNDKGGYLEVTFGPCATDKAKTCGVISKAFTKAGENPKSKNIGKDLLTGLSSKDGKSFTGGKIWDPENGNTYDATVTVSGDKMDVDGCLSIFCEDKHWTRAK